MATLPSGMVTFLFTDVEGSTSLLERHPEAYRGAIAQHHDMLARSVAQNRGAIFETVGDAVYAAFASPADAVTAAFLAQQELHNASWGETGPLRVRMGLHTGEVERQGDHYFGAALYRCARLSNTAHGGQVVLSSATAELVREGLPIGASLRDLGEHRLKDLQRPEHIFQLVGPELAADFPPLRALDTTTSNLPLQPTPFVGRAREMDAARKLLQQPETRLLTLIGPGGVGKTRLGLEIAGSLVGEFPDGTFFVELATVASAELVVPSIAKTLAVQETANRSTLDSVKDYLRDRQVQLVLDNFEHVTAAAVAVADLLAACPRIKTIVTTREALHLRGERQFPVIPLSRPDRGRAEPIDQLMRYEAIELFLERARTAKPEFAISERNVDAVAEICRRVDGLPLGIELAAARVNVFSPQALLAHLDHPLAVLTGGSRDLPVRQQTLRRAIAWSHDLLTPDEQSLYRRVAVFAGGCTLTAAQSVLGEADPDSRLAVVDGLASLVDKSLLRQEERHEAPRFRMLETIREDALERLMVSGDADQVQGAHADYYLAFAEQAEAGTREAEWLDRVAVEQDNLHAALSRFTRRGLAEHGLRLASALRRFWRARGYTAQGRERLAELLAQPAGRTRSITRAKALHAAGWLATQQGDYAEARTMFDESLDISRALGEPGGIGWAMVDLGLLSRYEGNYATAKGLLEDGLDLLTQARNVEGMAAALGNLGLIARDVGDTAEAEMRIGQSLGLWRKLGDRFGVGLSLNGLAMVARARGHLAVARARVEESLAVWNELGDRQNMANALTTAAALAREQREYAEARAHLAQSLQIFHELGDRRGVAFVLEGFACLAAAETQPIRAHYLATAAATLRQVIGTAAPPGWHAELERTLEAAARDLQSETIVEVHARARSATLHDTIEFAVEDPPSNKPGPPCTAVRGV